MKKLGILALFLLVSIPFALCQNEVSETEKQKILLEVEKCVKDTGSCDCSAFADKGQEYCSKLVNGTLACLSDFKSEKCQSIDPTKVMIGGLSIKNIVTRRVQDYDKQITDCVTSGTSCDCSQFPKSVQEFCNGKIQKQKDCLDSYDLDACTELENPNIKIFPDFTPQWIIDILDPLIRPLVRAYQEGMRNFAIGSAMKSVGICFSDPYNCDCSSIKYPTIRADCEQRARFMRNCLEYRDCAVAMNPNCDGVGNCTSLTKMPLVPEVTPGFMKPFLEPIVLQNVCPMMTGWPYDKGNYAVCDKM